jgi:hypothetical protein
MLGNGEFAPQETPEVGQTSDFMNSMQMWHSTRTQVEEMGRICMTRQNEEGDGKWTRARLWALLTLTPQNSVTMRLKLPISAHRDLSITPVVCKAKSGSARRANQALRDCE